ncbi:MAG: DUF2125 domain-containing protein [Caulobacterales bacterium]
MTHTADVPRRKPSRPGLYGPFVFAIVLGIVWSGVWVWLKGETERRLDAAASQLRAGGWKVAWATRQLGGYPFRLDVDFTGLTLAEPSGWALSAPQLKTEAYAYQPSRWIMVAPAGVTFTRPVGGPVSVGAQVLRASVSHWEQNPPRISVEGVGLTFAPAPGAKPFFVQSAQGLDLHTLAGPNDQGAIYFGLDGARGQLPGLMGRIAEGGPINLTGDAIFSHASQVAGPDWPSAVRRWSRSGGALQVRQVTVQAGEALLDARTGLISVDDNGRLSGSITAALRQAPRALTAMSQAGAIRPEAAAQSAAALAASPGADAAHVTLDFQAGQTRLGPVTIGPAPKVF